MSGSEKHLTMGATQSTPPSDVSASSDPTFEELDGLPASNILAEDATLVESTDSDADGKSRQQNDRRTHQFTSPKSTTPKLGGEVFRETPSHWIQTRGMVELSSDADRTKEAERMSDAGAPPQTLKRGRVIRFVSDRTTKRARLANSKRKCTRVVTEYTPTVYTYNGFVDPKTGNRTKRVEVRALPRGAHVRFVIDDLLALALPTTRMIVALSFSPCEIKTESMMITGEHTVNTISATSACRFLGYLLQRVFKAERSEHVKQWFLSTFSKVLRKSPLLVFRALTSNVGLVDPSEARDENCKTDKATPAHRNYHPLDEPTHVPSSRELSAKKKELYSQAKALGFEIQYRRTSISELERFLNQGAVPAESKVQRRPNVSTSKKKLYSKAIALGFTKKYLHSSILDLNHFIDAKEMQLPTVRHFNSKEERSKWKNRLFRIACGLGCTRSYNRSTISFLQWFVHTHVKSMSGSDANSDSSDTDLTLSESCDLNVASGPAAEPASAPEAASETEAETEAAPETVSRPPSDQGSDIASDSGIETIEVIEKTVIEMEATAKPFKDASSGQKVVAVGKPMHTKPTRSQICVTTSYKGREISCRLFLNSDADFEKKIEISSKFAYLAEVRQIPLVKHALLAPGVDAFVNMDDVFELFGIPESKKASVGMMCPRGFLDRSSTAFNHAGILWLSETYPSSHIDAMLKLF